MTEKPETLAFDGNKEIVRLNKNIKWLEKENLNLKNANQTLHKAYTQSEYRLRHYEEIVKFLAEEIGEQLGIEPKKPRSYSDYD